jgi:methyl-accepting chemotaxis protein
MTIRRASWLINIITIIFVVLTIFSIFYQDRIPILVCYISLAVLLFIAVFNLIYGHLTVVKPLFIFTKVLQEIAVDERTDLGKRIDIKGKNEIGVVAAFFNKTFDNISELVAVIKNKVNAFTTIGFELSNNMVKTSIAVKRISMTLNRIKNLITRQENEAVETDKTVKRIINNINELKEMIEEQADSINVSSCAIEVMTVNINTVTQTLAENTGNIKTLAEALENGRAGVHKAAQEIEKIADDAENLLKINMVMNNIANQTNQLSINTASETGNAEKDPSAAAEKFRKLAEASEKQTKNTEIMLKRIKASIDNIKKSSDDVLARFDAIDAGVKTVSEHEQNILNTMKEQDTSRKQILQDINCLKEISVSVRNGSLEMMASGNALVRQAEEYIKTGKETAGGINEITEGVNQINKAVSHVNDMSTENKSNFEVLKKEMEKFIDSGGSRNKKILLVDDDELHLEITEAMLKNDYDIIIANSGNEALTQFHQGLVPDLILLDLVMPDMDGWDTFEIIKGIGALHDVPIAFFSSSFEIDDIRRAFDIGANEYISKPVKREELLKTVSEMFNK